MESSTGTTRQRSAPATPLGDESALVARLRARDEAAFEELVRAYYPMMVRLARGFVRGQAAAEDVVQEAWIAVIRGLDRFEGRSSLRTWISSIVVNGAKTRAMREARSVPMDLEAPEAEAVVDPSRFRGAGQPFPGHWTAYPQRWDALPEGMLLSRETMDVVREAIEQLPPGQRTVISMRDIEGCDSAEVCAALGISQPNQRVLLHRARSAVRAALERYFETTAEVVA